MNIDPQNLGIGGILLALIGVIWKLHNERIRMLEQAVGKNKEVFNGKTPLIYASAARLDELEKRLDRLEDKLITWMDRIEDKIDGINRRGYAEGSLPKTAP